MATDLKPGERVLFRDGRNTLRIGIAVDTVKGYPDDWHVRAEGGRNTWCRHESELELAPYPYGEYIPTEGFDVARMPAIPQGYRYPHLNIVLIDSEGYTVPGKWYSDSTGIYEFDGTRCWLDQDRGDNVRRFTHLYIVPPLTTK